MCNFNVDIVYHAAAYKHVPLMEQNVMQCLKNNVFGTKLLAECAIENKVKSLILISTDKAVNPTNYMGLSKRLSEQICQRFNETQSTTRFTMVRFGNVSARPLSYPVIQKANRKWRPINSNASRYYSLFHDNPRSRSVSDTSRALSEGGEIYVLDMGKAIKIVDLAQKMILLSGFSPYIEGTGTLVTSLFG